ncbi:MAG: hypothetical protein ACREDA_00990 [Methylocella sp.]
MPANGTIAAGGGQSRGLAAAAAGPGGRLVLRRRAGGGAGETAIQRNPLQMKPAFALRTRDGGPPSMAQEIKDKFQITFKSCAGWRAFGPAAWQKPLPCAFALALHMKSGDR